MAKSLTSPVIVDADELKQVGLDFIISQSPGWQNIRGDGADLVLTAVAQMMSYGLAQYGNPTDAIASFVGRVVYDTPPFAAVSASSTVTMVTDGSTNVIPAGMYLAASDSDGNPVELQVTADVDVTSPTTSTPNVPVIVTEAGAGGNGLTGAVTLVDRIAFTVSATLDAPTGGGIDAETTPAYNQRIGQLAKLIAPRLILPDDFANGLRLFVPGVARTLAIDEYKADTATSGVARCVTVVGQRADGEPLNSDVKTAGRAELVRRRETTFLSFVIDPTYTTVNIAFDAVAEPGVETGSVRDAGIAALTALVHPRLHGIPSGGDATQWVARPKVRFQDAVTVLNNVPRLDHYTTLTLNGGTADITLPGPGGLPRPGTISGTVTAP